MATPGDLIKTVSECLHIPEATVFQHDRELVKAGYRRTGGRGRSSIQVTPQDAANLLIAIVGGPAFGPTVKESAVTLERYMSLPAWMDVDIVPGKWERALPRLSPGHGFRDALAEIISNFASGRFASPLNIWPELKQIIPLEAQIETWPDLPPTPGLFEVGVLSVEVSIDSPDASATIEIHGSTSLPDLHFAKEECRYFVLPDAGLHIYEGSPLRQKRNFDDGSLKEISKIFAQKP